MRTLLNFFRAGKLTCAAPRTDRWKVFEVLQIYQQIDREVERFQKASGLRCVAGCGHCCENPEIEATTLEVLPLVVGLWQKNKAELWLEKLSVAGRSPTCIFYEPHIARGAKGHCQVYAWRPLICRLFGFAAIADKYGHNELVTCARIKETLLARYSAAIQKISQGFPVPQMTEYSRRIGMLDLSLGQERFQINEAVKKGLGRTGLLMTLNGRRNT